MIAATTVASTIYLVLTISALLSTFSPELKSLSSHGKTRASNHESKHTHHHIHAAGIFRRMLQFLLSSQKLTVGKCRFLDFYAVGIFTTLCLVYTTIVDDSFTLHSDYEWNEVFLPSCYQWLPACLLLTHLTRRYCECRWVQKSGTHSRMHLAGYFLGILHYLCLPLLLIPHPSSLTRSNDEICYTNLGSIRLHYSSKDMIVGTIATIGLLYFQYQQHRHHVILANLRSTNTKSTSSYSVPMGGWFEYVSCPHYFSEMMIYLMFAILLENAPTFSRSGTRAWVALWHEQLNISIPHRRDLSGEVFIFMLLRLKHWVLWWWVVTNLSISAMRTHDWYLDSFGATYPQQRKRLIPFLW